MASWSHIISILSFLDPLLFPLSIWYIWCFSDSLLIEAYLAWMVMNVKAFEISCIFFTSCFKTCVPLFVVYDFCSFVDSSLATSFPVEALQTKFVMFRFVWLYGLFTSLFSSDLSSKVAQCQWVPFILPNFGYIWTVPVLYQNWKCSTHTENVFTEKLREFNHCSMPEKFALHSSKMALQQLIRRLPPYHKVGIFQRPLHPMYYAIKCKFEPDDRPIFGDQILNTTLSLKWNFIDSFCHNQKTDAPHISTMPQTKNWAIDHNITHTFVDKANM